jgi:hypothetical protein
MRLAKRLELEASIYSGAARCLPDGLSYTVRLTMLLLLQGSPWSKLARTRRLALALPSRYHGRESCWLVYIDVTCARRCMSTGEDM